MGKTFINIEYAYNLMMKGNVIASLLLLSKEIDTGFKTHDKPDMFRALVLRAILNLHVGFA